MSSSQAKPVECFLEMVGFSSDKINILQQIKHFFNSAIALVPGGARGNIILLLLMPEGNYCT